MSSTFFKPGHNNDHNIMQNPQMLHEKFDQFQIWVPNISRHLATAWPNVLNMLHPTLLRYIAFKCCDHFTGAQRWFPVCCTAQSQNPNVYKHYKWLTRWNANRCSLLRNTYMYLIFEIFQILFPTASLIFKAVKLFHEAIWERTKY